MQTRLHSLIESLSNVAVGFLLALGTQLVTFPMLGIEASIGDHFILTVIFTAVSIIRSYVLRRIFNRVTYGKKQALRAKERAQCAPYKRRTG